MQLKKKKKKTNMPTRYTMDRNRRLQSAKSWMATYEGKNMVRSYAKRYRTDLLCAIQELKLLGVEIKPEYENAVRQTIAQRIEQNRKKKEAKLAFEEFEGVNEYQGWDFAYIAGYTSGGAPYGIRWEDMPSEEETKD